MGFNFKQTRDGNHTGIVEEYIITNSKTVAVGDICRFAAATTSDVEDAIAAESILGVIVGIVTVNGVPLDAARSGTDYDGTWTSATQSYAASSDNLTDKQVKAQVQVHPYAIYSATPDADIATTTGSDTAGHYSDAASKSTLDESSVLATSAQFWVLGLDPNDATKVLVQIAESQGKGEDVDAA